jgi:hypothetical protein
VTAPFTCPSGHASATGDYCDTCGAAIAPPTGKPADPEPIVVSASPGGGTAPAGLRCSNCGAERVAEDVFCEVCGLDFATGKLPSAPPKPAAAAPSSASPALVTGWTIIVEADRDYFDKNQAEGGVTLSFPEGQTALEVPLTKDEVHVGRGGIADVDLNHIDPGVSHRHLRLLRHPDGNGWDVVDDDSANGTWIDEGSDPIDRAAAVPVGDGSSIHIGAFTTMTLRDDRAAAKAQP